MGICERGITTDPTTHLDDVWVQEQRVELIARTVIAELGPACRELSRLAVISFCAPGAVMGWG